MEISFVVSTISLLFLSVIFSSLSGLIIYKKFKANYLNNLPIIEYSAHVQYKGWLDLVGSGEVAGTINEGLRFEALRIQLKNNPKNVGIESQVDAYEFGWMEWAKEGEQSGTVGQSRPVFGIRIRLTNTRLYSVRYKVSAKDIGWMDWKYNGEIAGTNNNTQLEAIKIEIY